MKNRDDAFAQMKNEDRAYGERAGKNIAKKAGAKKQKNNNNFKNMRPQDLMSMSDDYEDDFQSELEEN